MKRRRAHSLATALAMLASVTSPMAYAQMPTHMNDFPTETRAEYIFGCMQVNGNNRVALEKCSCSIDVIASIISHVEYVDAETTLSMRMRGGESVSYMQGPQYNAKVKALKLAQIEGELRCF
jgi:hypothetical protein